MPQRAGCGIAPVSGTAWKTVTSVQVLSLDLSGKRAVVEVVFLDATKRRVLPTGRKVSMDMRFKRRHRRSFKLLPDGHKDGVFRFQLPRNRRAKPCKSHLFVRFHNGSKMLEDWIDDWLYSC